MQLRRGAVLTLASQWGRYALQIISLVLLSRVLVPADFGLIAMATAITGLAGVIGDFGLSLAAMRASALTQAQRTNLFWLNSALGLVTGGIVAAASPAIAAFYSDPRLVPVVLATSAVFVLNGAVVQHGVELNRSGRFGTLGGVEFGAQAFALVLAVAAALAGAGYWALVVQQLAASALRALGFVTAARWRPGLPTRGSGIRPLLAFGRDTFAVQVANYVTTNLDSALIGRTFSPTVLGLYNRAFQLIMLPIQQVVSPLTRVFLPRLAALEGEAFSALLVRLQKIVVYLLLGPLSFVGACAPGLVPLLLGPQWSGSGEIVQVLVVGGAFQTLGFVYYWAFLARDRTAALFRSELWGRVVMVIAMLLLVRFGPLAVAASVALGQLLIWLAGTLRYGPAAGIETRRIVGVAIRPCLVFLAAGLLGGGGAQVLARDDVSRLLISALLWLVVVAAGVAASRAARADLLEIGASLGFARRTAKSPPPQESRPIALGRRRA